MQTDCLDKCTWLITSDENEGDRGCFRGLPRGCYSFSESSSALSMSWMRNCFCLRLWATRYSFSRSKSSAGICTAKVRSDLSSFKVFGEDALHIFRQCVQLQLFFFCHDFCVEIGGYHGTEVLFSLHRFCSFPRFCKQSIPEEVMESYSPNSTKKLCETEAATPSAANRQGDEKISRPAIRKAADPLLLRYICITVPFSARNLRQLLLGHRPRWYRAAVASASSQAPADDRSGAARFP